MLVQQPGPAGHDAVTEHTHGSRRWPSLPVAPRWTRDSIPVMDSVNGRDAYRTDWAAVGRGRVTVSKRVGSSLGDVRRLAIRAAQNAPPRRLLPPTYSMADRIGEIHSERYPNLHPRWPPVAVRSEEFREIARLKEHYAATKAQRMRDSANGALFDASLSTPTLLTL